MFFLTYNIIIIPTTLQPPHRNEEWGAAFTIGNFYKMQFIHIEEPNV
jgi:hypothetical protein